MEMKDGKLEVFVFDEHGIFEIAQDGLLKEVVAGFAVPTGPSPQFANNACADGVCKSNLACYNTQCGNVSCGETDTFCYTNVGCPGDGPNKACV